MYGSRLAWKKVPASLPDWSANAIVVLTCSMADAASSCSIIIRGEAPKGSERTDTAAERSGTIVARMGDAGAKASVLHSATSSDMGAMSAIRRISCHGDLVADTSTTTATNNRGSSAVGWNSSAGE